MTKRWILNFLFMALGAFILLLAFNLAGYGPAIVRYERARVVLPPQTAAHHHHGARQAKATPATHTAAPTVAVPAPAPQRVQVDVNVNVHVPQPTYHPTMAMYHDGVVCYQYHGCTHYWVDPPVQTEAQNLPYCAPGYIGRTCR